MDLKKIKKDWDYYCRETEENEIVDIDLHFSMAMEVGVLINEVEKQQKEIKELISINLWSARRLPTLNKTTTYDELEKITGCKYERL